MGPQVQHPLRRLFSGGSRLHSAAGGEGKFLSALEILLSPMTNRRTAAHCYRCGYYWYPRKARVRICARCKSPYFATPRLRLPTYGSGLGIDQVIGDRRSELLRLVRRFGAREARVFGSVARREATLASDVDILVDSTGRRFDPVSLGIELKRLLGRRVDVVSESSLHWFVQPQVIAEAIPL